jgi:hypothetical protein
VTGSSILARIRSHLVDDVRRVWTWATTYWHLIFGAVTAYCADPSNWSAISSTFYSIPAEYRMFVPYGVGFFIGVIPILLRIWKQPRRNG